jgi:predicted Zn-dependent peptidase
MKPVMRTFPSGLRLIVIPQPDATTATALVLVGTGSSYENDSRRGLSHFLEHICFKGTTRRPSTRAIAEELDAIGAVSNAFTSNEYTGYYAKGNPAHLPTFIDVLGDIYLHSTFPPEEIEKEKGVIIEEMNMYEDQLPQKAGELLLQLMYGDQPAGRPLIGTKESVLSYTRNDFIEYVRAHYHAGNTVVTIAGPITMAAVEEHVATAFAAIPTAPQLPMKQTDDAQQSFVHGIVHRPSDQAHIAIGFRSVPYRHADARTLQILATLMGRGMSSRLFQILREDMGAAYYVHVEQEGFLDHGIFGIGAGIDKTRINEILARIASELSLLKTTLVPQAELSKAIEYAVGMLRLGLETTDEIASFCGTPLVLGKDLMTPKDIEQEYRAVTAEDIQRIAQTIFVGTNASLAIVGPYTEGAIDTAPLAAL